MRCHSARRCIIIDIQFDRAVAVVPLRVLAADDPRYVSTDTISNVLRTYRKHLDLSPEEGAIVERLSNDLFEAMESDAGTLLSTSPARSVECRWNRVSWRLYKTSGSLLDQKRW